MAWSIALVRGVGVTHSDAALIARCQKADVAAFNEIVARYKGKIYSYVYRMTGNAEDAEDLTQRGFREDVHGHPRVPRRGEPLDLALPIAGNLCVDSFRRKKTRGTALSLDAPLDTDDAAGAGREIPDGALAPETLLGRKELADHIQKAIEKLPPKLRSAIVLHDVEGLAYEEIAEVEKVPLGTVKSRIFNGRVALRETLRPYLEA